MMMVNVWYVYIVHILMVATSLNSFENSSCNIKCVVQCTLCVFWCSYNVCPIMLLHMCCSWYIFCWYQYLVLDCCIVHQLNHFFSASLNKKMIAKPYLVHFWPSLSDEQVPSQLVSPENLTDVLWREGCCDCGNSLQSACQPLIKRLILLLSLIV